MTTRPMDMGGGRCIIQQRSPRRRRATAYHEAGHAVIAFVLGGRLESVRSAFELVDVPDPKPFDRRRFILPNVSYSLHYIAFPDAWRLMIKFKFAGYIAERRVSGDDPRFAARGDFHQARQLLERLHTKYPQFAADEETLMQEVEGILGRQDVWNAVTTVAAALEVSGEVDGKRATDLIAQAIKS